MGIPARPGRKGPPSLVILALASHDLTRPSIRQNFCSSSSKFWRWNDCNRIDNTDAIFLYLAIKQLESAVLLPSRSSEAAVVIEKCAHATDFA
jgi:hypothetical protein